MSIVLDLEADRGASLSITLRVMETATKIFDLTGFSGRARICEDDAYSTELAEVDSVVIDASTGDVTVNFLPAHTLAVETAAVWDVFVSSPAGDVSLRLARGVFLVIR